ncbi:MAG: 2-oxo acid dehydrogenase subunit E2 [Cryomorphaceae bacterium]|nr:MAG: 2-oxo acid dehydrogenase subunit E2 [Cryomorphaceae bacterium]
MSKEIEILLPKMGESVAEATVIKWLKSEGEMVEADEPIIEIATDKVDSEVPAPGSGILSKQLCQEGDVVQVGAVIAMLATDAAADAAPAAPEPPRELQSSREAGPSPSNGSAVAAAPAMASVGGGGNVVRAGSTGRFYSPLVRNIAIAEGIGMEELDSIPGTGSEGRVTKKDIMAYLPNRGKGIQDSSAAPAKVPATKDPAAAPATKSSGGMRTIEAPPISVGEGDEIIEMDRMRKLISEHMVMSKHVSPHVTSFVEADVTNLVRWRDKIKKDFEKREGEKITFTPLFIEAIVKAIKDFPMINISLDGDKIIKRKHINVGMAAALPSGNLIVPVIRDADTLNLVGITKKVNDLANRARNNQLKPDEIGSGTYTITNVGSFGNVMGTPIINQPQVAIMATGAIRKKPAVMETPEGDVIAIRHMMFLSHSYDHRIVDGALGGMFVRRVADYLEQFDVNRTI